MGRWIGRRRSELFRKHYVLFSCYFIYYYHLFVPMDIDCASDADIMGWVVLCVRWWLGGGWVVVGRLGGGWVVVLDGVLDAGL